MFSAISVIDGAIETLDAHMRLVEPNTDFMDGLITAKNELLRMKERAEKDMNEKKNELEIAKCPFCGSLPQILEGYDQDGIHYNVGCCNLWTRKSSTEDSISWWNRTVSDLTKTQKPTILDSGDRTEFDTGAVRDLREGKGRLDLMPLTAVIELSKHCEDGAKKYGEHNVDKGIPQHCFCDSAMRHLIKYMRGDTDELHLRAAAWNIMWALEQSVTKADTDLIDIPWTEK